MTKHRRLALTVSAAFMLTGAVSGTTSAAEPQRHVIGESGIQDRIDDQLDAVAADREAIRTMLQQPDVRRIAGTAGLDVDRAIAAAATLSGSDLANLAAQARVVNADLVGGADTIVISATTLLIILLIVILVAR